MDKETAEISCPLYILLGYLSVLDQLILRGQ